MTCTIDSSQLLSTVTLVNTQWAHQQSGHDGSGVGMNGTRYMDFHLLRPMWHDQHQVLNQPTAETNRTTNRAPLP